MNLTRITLYRVALVNLFYKIQEKTFTEILKTTIMDCGVMCIMSNRTADQKCDSGVISQNFYQNEFV